MRRRNLYSKNTSNPIITDGLVLNLDSGNSASYPGSGSVWLDLSGNGNNAFLTNNVLYSSLNGGNLFFDGMNGSAYMNNSNVFDASTHFSISFFVKYLFDSPTDFPCLMSKGLGISNSWQIFIYNQYPAVFFKINGFQISAPYPTDGLFHNITITKNDVYVNIYIDSIFKTSYLIGQNTSNTNYFIIGTDGGNSFKGYINSILIYDKTLSQPDITQNFNVTRLRYSI